MEAFLNSTAINLCKNKDNSDLDKGLSVTSVRTKMKFIPVDSKLALALRVLDDLLPKNPYRKVINESMLRASSVLLSSDSFYLGAAFKSVLKQLTIGGYSQNQPSNLFYNLSFNVKHLMLDVPKSIQYKSSNTSAVPNTTPELSSGTTVLLFSSYSSQQTSDSSNNDSSTSLMPNSSASSHSAASSDTDFVYSSDVETHSTITTASSLQPMSSSGNQTISFHQKSCADQKFQDTLVPVQPTDFLHTTIDIVPVVYHCTRHHTVQQPITPELDHAPLLTTASQLLEAQEYMAVVQMLTKIGDSMESAESEAARNLLLGIVLMQLKRYDEAIVAFEKATQFAGSAAYADYNLGEIELINHRLASAVRHFETAVQLHSDLSQHLFQLVNTLKPSRCAMLTKLAHAQKNAQDISSAVQTYQEAIAAGENDPSTPVSDLVAAQINHGNLLHSVGDHAAAFPYYKKGIELSEQCGDMVSHAWAHGNLGNTYLSLSQYKQAYHHLQLSLDLTLQHEPTPAAIGRAYNNLGTYYQAVGDLDKAQECYDTALGHGVYGQDQAGQARAYGNIGNVYMLKNIPERAIPHYSEVLHLTRDRQTAAVAHHNRGCAYFELAEKKKMFEQSEKCHDQNQLCGQVNCLMESECALLHRDYYCRAHNDFIKVIQDHEQTFASIKGSSSGLNLSVTWFETNAKTFLRAQDCAYSLGDYNRALVYAEQCRARTLGELLNSKTSCHGTPFNTPLQSDSISHIVKHLNTLHVPVVVLSYTGTRLLVWVLVWDGEEVKMTSFEQKPDGTMFDGKTFDHYIRYSLSEMLTGGLQLYGGLEDQTISDESPAAKLFELIGRPLLRILEVMGCSGSRMVLVPDSYTKLLPFSALYDSKRQCFLGDSHSIVYSPSLLTLGVMSKMPHVAVQVPLDSKDMCVVGNPTTPPFMYNKEEWDLGPLPYATEEARSVAHMLQTTPLLHQEATKDAVLAKISRAKVIHLATHGSAGDGFLVLGSSSHNFATVAKHTVQDPSTLLLHASELESLDIPAALVVLSSCDSGRGVIRGDDIQGMARSFLLAGARAVLTSLWKAPDESASFFMLYFYRYLLDGYKASDALQKTSHSIRCFVKYSNFVHWSGHQLTGQDVMVTHTFSSEDRAVRNLLGISLNTFPRFDVLHSLTDALSKYGPHVQLLCGHSDVDLVESVTDYISSNYSQYPGGIVWVHDNNQGQLTDSHAGRMLIILDGCDRVDGIPNELLKSSKNTVFVISDGDAEETNHRLRRFLSRPVSVHEIKPLSELHTTQRLVYSVQSSFHLAPSAADQSAFQQLAHLTMGSPILIRMVQYLLHHNMAHSSSPSEGLLNTVHSIEEMMLDGATSRLAVISAVCNTLSTAAQRLLHCLSCLDGLPVSLEYIEGIANMIQPANHQPTLVTELRQAAVLLGYPAPVVIGPTRDKPQSPLLYVPVSVAESVWTESSLHNKALSLLVIKNAVMKSYCNTVCHQVLKSWETTMISDSQDHDTATILYLKEHFIELMEKYQSTNNASTPDDRPLIGEHSPATASDFQTSSNMLEVDHSYQSDTSNNDIQLFSNNIMQGYKSDMTDQMSNEQHPVMDQTSNEQPPVIDQTSNEQPPVMDQTSNEQPDLTDQTSNEQPPVMDQTSNEQPPVMDQTSNEQPPMMDQTSNEQPDLTDQTS